MPKLFKFDTSEVTDLGDFYRMMQAKYPHIIMRKRFCASEAEVTDKLKEDCAALNVQVVPLEV